MKNESRIPQTQAKDSDQPPAADQHGTDQSPTIVKIIGTEPKAQNGASNNPNDDQKKPSPDWWSIGIAGGTLLVLVLQLIAFIVQASRLGQTIRVMKDTAERQLRAYVVIDRIDLPSVQVPSTHFLQRNISIAFKNTGDTPTRGLTAAVNHVFRDHIDIETFDFPDLPNAMQFFGFIGPNQSVNIPHIGISDVKLRDSAWFLIWGWIEYNDTFSAHRRRTEFSFRVRIHGDPFERGSIIWFESTQKHNAADEDCMKPPQTVLAPSSALSKPS